MFDSPTRRSLLRLAAAGTVSALSGCSESLPGFGDESSDPDAGRDSYGILLTNETDETHTVQIEVTPPFDDETAFEETVSIDGGASREWEEVVTENKEWSVTGKLKDVETADRLRSDNLWITPGSEDAPAVENIKILVNPIGDGNGTPGLSVTHDG